MPLKIIAAKPAVTRVGIDLDGVILYNPARLVRPLITGFKRQVLHRQKTKFFIPSSPFEQWLFRLFHKSSIYVAPGLPELKRMVKSGQLTAFVITARFDFLKDDFHRWLKKIHASDYFTDWYHNAKNEQPHLYKLNLIKKLNLDVFIEDNFDIVSHLVRERELGHHHADIYWIYNLFDARKPYRYKYPSLQQAILAIGKNRHG